MDKQRISLEDWQEFITRYPEAAGRFYRWADLQGYTETLSVGAMGVSRKRLSYLPTLGEMMHFLSIMHTRRDDILSGVRDRVMEFENITIAWDGEKLCDILWWQTVEIAKKFRL